MKDFKTKIITLVLFAGLFPSVVFAGVISTQPQSVVVPQPDSYTVSVLLNSEDESLNAVEGVVSVNSSLGEVLSVTDSGSIITYWVSPPKWDGKTRTISFSGTIPGGFTGNAGILFSLVLPAYSGQNISDAITFNSISALRNDGLGSSARITSKNFGFGTENTPVDVEVKEQLYTSEGKKDNIPPEIFSPQLSRDERVFDNKWFINFSTTDKQSGIDHYEIQETRTGTIDPQKWERAESPYQLKDQELHSYIYVIAIDRQGNERVIKVFPRVPLVWWQKISSIVATIVVVVVVGVLLWRIRKRKQNKHVYYNK